MTETAYIHDGYTKKARIKREPGLNPEVNFSFRPATAQQHEMVMHRMNRTNRDEDSSKYTAEVIAKHVIEWDVKGPKGDLEVTVPNVLRLAPTVFNRLFTIVMGVSTGDSVDDERESESNNAISYAAQLAGITETEAEVKN